MIICFTEERRGLLCNLPPGGGPWIVPSRKERHAVAFSAGQVLDVEITGASQAGNLRFCRVVRNITVEQKAALEKLQEAAQAAQKYEELRRRTWSILSVPSLGFSFSRSYRYDVCIKADGKPAVSSFEVEGRWLECETHSSLVANYAARPKIALVDPLPLSGKEAQQALCYLVVAIATPNYTSKKCPTWADEFFERVLRYIETLEETEKRTSGKTRKQNGLDWAAIQWLEDETKRLDVFDLDALIKRVEIPLEKAESELDLLIPSMPTHIRLSDGVEHGIVWESGWCDEAWRHIGTIHFFDRDESIFESVEVDQDDPRAATIKIGGNGLQIKTLRPCQYPVETFESPFSGMGCYEVTRQLI